jgi:hypothetical protein
VSPTAMSAIRATYLLLLVVVSGLAFVGDSAAVYALAVHGLALVLLELRAWERRRRALREVRQLGASLGLDLSSPAVRRRLHDSTGGAGDVAPDTARRTSAARGDGTPTALAAEGRSLVEEDLARRAIDWRCPDHGEASLPSISITRERLLTTCRICARCEVFQRRPPSPPPPPRPPAPPVSVHGDAAAGRGGGR